jgi:hypothetical protein
MAAPVVSVTAPTSPLAPGSIVEFTWTVSDADNRTINYAWAGTDSTGAPASGTGSLTVQDNFTMTSFTLGGVALSIDNANRKATGVVPAA